MKRITEAELQKLERLAAVSPALALALVGEVRRLRGIILRGVEVDLYSERQNPGGQEAAAALEAEARSIREETGPTTGPAPECAP